jgi:hypothetical protein
MKDSKRILWSLLSLLIIVSLVTPAWWPTIVRASTGDFAGGSGIPGDPYQIADWQHLDNVRNHLAYHFVLMNDLDSTTAGYGELAGPSANEGKGWQPIGTEQDPFTGSFNGQGYEIGDLYINRPDEGQVGLFGCVGEAGTIQYIGVMNAEVIGFSAVGSLVGSNLGTVGNSHATSSVIGEQWVGGLVGDNWGTIRDSYAAGSITGTSGVGGLVGATQGEGTVDNCHATADVHGGEGVGGLVGVTWESTVSNSYSTGNVTGDSDVGGLVGWNHRGTVSNSHAASNVTGAQWVGGLVGSNWGIVSASRSAGSTTGTLGIGGLVGTNQGEGTLDNCYSTATVSGGESIGGLVGVNWEGKVGGSYSTGNVTGDSGVGGLVGFNTGTVSSSFWDMQTSGKEQSAGGTGKTTEEMKDIATFTDTGRQGLDDPWDIVAVAPDETDDSCIWNIVDEKTYPFLNWEDLSFLVIDAVHLPAGEVGVAYEVTLAVAGGAAPYNWAIVEGWLPEGLELDADAGLIAGTPTQRGQFRFAVRVTDAGGFTATRALSITVFEIVEMALSLQAGWNMVSLPLHTGETGPSVLLPDHVALYGWNSTTLSYYVPEELVPGQGYWVLYFAASNVTISGLPVEHYALVDADPGWHMIGSVLEEAQVIVLEGSTYDRFYWWDPEILSYRAAEKLEAGKGYWLLGFTHFTTYMLADHDIVVPDPRERLKEDLGFTDEQMDKLETGEGTLQLTEHQVTILSDYVTQLLDDLEPWLDEAQWQEVKAILESMLAQGEIDLETLGPVAEAIGAALDAMAEAEAGVSVYTNLVRVPAGAAASLEEYRHLSSGPQLSTVVLKYTPRDSGYGDRHFEQPRTIRPRKTGRGGESVASTNHFDGSLGAYSDAFMFCGVTTYALQRVLIHVPADDTDVSIKATLQYMSGKISGGLPSPVNFGSTAITTVAPYKYSPREQSDRVIDPWLEGQTALN